MKWWVATVVVGVLVVAGCSSREPTGDASANSTSTASARPTSTVATSEGTEPTTAAVAETEAVVTDVVDGDTIHVTLAGRDERVRLIGINAPEVTDDECFSTEATAALADLVDGQTVRLVRDQSDRDDYDRLLRYVFVGGTFVNEELVRHGFAQADRFPPDTARADQLDAAQAAAQAAGAGLWAPDACGPAPSPSEQRVTIARIEADPPGTDDNDNLNAEFVVVTNGGITAVDLTGWGLKDDSASHRFAFPAGFSLGAGADVTIHTGCGTATATDLFWCNQGSAIWNNDGDTAFLVDPAGNVVDTRSY